MNKIAFRSFVPGNRGGMMGGAHFAQINVMGDHLTHGLAANGFSCLKLVPCGSVSDVMPWLARQGNIIVIGVSN